jgi:hypothetical protein
VKTLQNTNEHLAIDFVLHTSHGIVCYFNVVDSSFPEAAQFWVRDYWPSIV